MRKLNYCMQCNKTAILLNGEAPYCVKCYREIIYVKRKSNKKAFETIRERKYF